ncbi:MAG: murein transglycosylase A [Alphaproteobacteria bacterium]
MRPTVVHIGLAVGALAVVMIACERILEPRTEFTLSPIRIAELPGWAQDNQAAALPAWRRTCGRLMALAPEKNLGAKGVAGKAGDWHDICARIEQLPNDPERVRAFIEANLTAFLVTTPTGPTGTFTGYFEPELHGTRQRDGRYKVPIYGLPNDHVRVDLGNFDQDLVGKRIVGRVDDGELVPYHTRGDIDNGALDGQATALFWVEDVIDAFVLHVQGSGRIVLPDGSVERIGFADHNGFDYTSIGRWLIKRGELAPHEASFNTIRGWIEANPKRAQELLSVNRRYIFFRKIPGDGPIGAAGEVLTPERSLAIDPRFIPLGVPIWLDAEHPLREGRLRRLVLAQDTGNAITGVVRGDFFWGSGRAAHEKADRMKSEGQYYVLIPKHLAPSGVAALR